MSLADGGRARSRPSLQRRVRRFTFLIVALAVLVTGVGGYVATRVSVYRAIDAILVTVSEAGVRGLGPTPDEASIKAYLATLELGYVVPTVVRTDGEVIRLPGAEAIPVDARDRAVAAGQVGPATRSVTTESGSLYRVRTVPLGSAPGAALLVARPMAAVQQILRAVALALVAFGLLAVVAAGLVGRRVARAGVAPVRELTGVVEARAASGELEPVPVGRDDEIGRLAVAFNHLLHTISVSRTQQDRFVADAGHELRTPLTSMRTNVELLAFDADRELLHPADRRAIVADVRAQLVEFTDLVTDLVALTRDDRSAGEVADVDLTAVLDATVERLSMQRAGLVWRVDLEPTTVLGDAGLLGRAFANVLDNAVKYSPDGGTIAVTLHDGEVRICDQGRGIIEAERPYVFDRFFRSEASRATPGTGLGLSITESVVRQHGGRVAVTDAPGGGAQLVLTFPTRSPGAAETGGA